MSEGLLQTEFAPAERSDRATIRRQAAMVARAELLPEFANALTEMVLIVNRDRQIVFSNNKVSELLGLDNPDRDIHGKRPGELLGCVRSCERAGGCGTTRFCATCGAVAAILTSLSGRTDVQECRILQTDGEALDLLVRTTPLVLASETFVIAAITDISHEKRRRALERIFFHDSLNTALSLKMSAALLDCRPDEDAEPELIRVRELSERLLSQIVSQRDLSAAETHELGVTPMEIRSRTFLDQLSSDFQGSEGRHAKVVVAEDAADTTFVSDPSLLERVVGNMITNAVEASAAGETVTLGCRAAEDGVALSVHNPGVMPAEAQMQVFQRSFSTKGPGRGLGTYSMKLLGEQYLSGQVSFRSEPGEGTTFTIRVPRRSDSHEDQ